MHIVGDALPAGSLFVVPDTGVPVGDPTVSRNCSGFGHDQGKPALGGVVIPFSFNSCDVVINQSLLSHLFWAPLLKMASSAPIEAADGFSTTTTAAFQKL